MPSSIALPIQVHCSSNNGESGKKKLMRRACNLQGSTLCKYDIVSSWRDRRKPSGSPRTKKWYKEICLQTRLPPYMGIRIKLLCARHWLSWTGLPHTVIVTFKFTFNRAEPCIVRDISSERICLLEHKHRILVAIVGKMEGRWWLCCLTSSRPETAAFLYGQLGNFSSQPLPLFSCFSCRFWA